MFCSVTWTERLNFLIIGVTSDNLESSISAIDGKVEEYFKKHNLGKADLEVD